MATESRVPKQLTPFEPGKSGNPAGRPKGSRNKLGEVFIQALYADFTEHGPEVIERVRVEEPAAYMRVVAGILPKEVKIDNAPLSELSDDDLARLIDLVRNSVGISGEVGTGTPEAGKGKPSRGLSTLQ